jgi:phosphoribosylanthranilate isomerase
MKNTKIKICGLFRLCDIDCCNKEKPDYVGFVFAESRRKLTLKTASALKENLDTRIKAVGVFVNESSEIITEIFKSGVIDLVQLHGDETDEYIESLKAGCGCQVIKSGRSRAADYLLFDSPKPGSGKTFDWDSIGQTDKQFFLAGGLDSSNVETAIKKLSPFAVDVSSGVESDGVKDAVKIREFIRIARGRSGEI